ncbi:MAG TPA: hypothetical protein VFQ39_14875, partial [Longimicrobium sp.]|nr:hypothetical protein [Longimicrobium sp.]
GRGERIAVALEPSHEAAVAVLAALKAGACAVAVDPRGRRASDAPEEVAVAVTRSWVASRLHLPCAVLSLDDDAELIARERPEPGGAEADADATALVLGGVPVSHALLAAAVRLPRETLRGVPLLATLAALAGEWEEGGAGG